MSNRSRDDFKVDNDMELAQILKEQGNDAVIDWGGGNAPKGESVNVLRSEPNEDEESRRDAEDFLSGMLKQRAEGWSNYHGKRRLDPERWREYSKTMPTGDFEVRFCPHCGTQYMPDAQYCFSCGEQRFQLETHK